MSATNNGSATGGEAKELLLIEVAAITSLANAYTAEFISKCAVASDDLIFHIKQVLRKLENFSIREFDRRIKEARLATMQAQEPTTTGWKAMLSRNERGAVQPLLCNAMLALRHAPEWQGVLAYNLLAYRIEKLKAPPYQSDGEEWKDIDDIKTAEWLQLNGIAVTVNVAAEAANGVAAEHRFHPIRDYLKSLEWDGEKRISDFLTNYFNVEPSEVVKLISTRWLISAVARVMKPGCQVDTCLVLEGSQGLRKSTALRALAVNDRWFADQIAGLDQKDASQDLDGKWIIEFSEVDKFSSKHDQGVIKSFIPRMIDHYRQSYGRRSQDFPRQCVFAASSNKCTWAGDETGGRRWWPVRCGSKVDIDGIRRDRDQLWAEAYVAYLDGTRWWFDEADNHSVIEALEEEQRARYDPDPWDERIMAWVDNDEKEFTAKEAAHAKEHHRSPEAYYLKTDSILELCLKKPVGLWIQPDKNRVAGILTFHKFERFQRRVTTADGLQVYLDPPENKRPKREYAYRRVMKARNTSTMGDDSGDK